MPDKSYDPIPSMAYALMAHRKAAGDRNSKYQKSFEAALSQLTKTYGTDTVNQLMEVVLNTNKDYKGDANEALRKSAKDGLSNKKINNQYVRNFLAVADQNPDILNKFTYGFDLPESASEGDRLMTKLTALMHK